MVKLAILYVCLYEICILRKCVYSSDTVSAALCSVVFFLKCCQRCSVCPRSSFLTFNESRHCFIFVNVCDICVYTISGEDISALLELNLGFNYHPLERIIMLVIINVHLPQ